MDKISEPLKGTTLAKALQATLEGEKVNDYLSRYESVLHVCEIQTFDKSNLVPKGASSPGTKPGAGSDPLAKGDLGLPADFWGDWTSDVDEDGEPLDKHGNPFFEPYDPYGIVRAVLKDPSFP